MLHSAQLNHPHPPHYDAEHAVARILFSFLVALYIACVPHFPGERTKQATVDICPEGWWPSIIFLLICAATIAFWEFAAWASWARKIPADMRRIRFAVTNLNSAVDHSESMLPLSRSKSTAWIFALGLAALAIYLGIPDVCSRVPFEDFTVQRIAGIVCMITAIMVTVDGRMVTVEW